LTVSFKDYRGHERKKSASFNLDAREVFKMLPELKAVFDWLDSNKTSNPRELDTQEVSTFYTNFEGILLEAWGEMSEDGLYFRKAGKYEFEESALFNACMVKFVTKPEEAVKLLEGVLPPELTDMVKNADETQLAAANDTKVADANAEIARLRAQIENGNA
jgi:hypothetical protein